MLLKHQRAALGPRARVDPDDDLAAQVLGDVGDEPVGADDDDDVPAALSSWIAWVSPWIGSSTGSATQQR